MRLVASIRVELVCVSLSIVGAVILTVATIVSRSAYVNCPGSSCALYASFSSERGPTCGDRAVCNLAIVLGVASFAVGVLFLLQICRTMKRETYIREAGKRRGLRPFLIAKVFMALLCVLGLFAIAIVTSVGVTVYCDNQQAVWKQSNETEQYPGCQKYDEWVARLPNSGWPSNGFMTMQAMLVGVWISFVFWLCVLVVNIAQYQSHQQLARSNQFTQLKDSTVTSYDSNAS